jgi:putative chitinase
MSMETTRMTAAVAAVAPQADLRRWVPPLKAGMARWAVNTPRRAALFLGQVAVESEGFRRTKEDLSYSAERMCEVWPSHFPAIADALPFAFRPRALACRIYANRLGNGPEESGDGWTFIGRGLIQLTGRGNYEEFARAVGKTPEAAATYLETCEGASESAAWFFQRAGLDALADADPWNLREATRRINGGELGLKERTELALRALKELVA